MNAVIYARYSSDNQREESIEGQLRECQEYADQQGITILGTYIDRALSAKTDNRPEFQRMIKDGAKRLFDIVLVWKLDRFARNRYDSARYKAVLRKNGVRVISAKENISEGPEGIILESMLEGYAEYFSADLSEKVLRGMTENALKCRTNGSRMPLGYISNSEHKYQIDPKTAPIVVEVFTRYADGETVTEIINDFNSRGIKSAIGKPFNKNSFSKMLHNRRYIGEYKFRDIIIPDGVPHIVPQDLFDRVQERLKKNRKAPARKKAKENYLLTTKLYCGKCGAFMVGESGTSRWGNLYHYYKCAHAKREKTCDKKAVKKEWIEQMVVQKTMEIALSDDVIDRTAESILELQKKENTVLPGLRAQLKETEKGITNMLNAIQQGVLTPSTKERLEELEKTKKELEVSIMQEQMQKPMLTKEQIVFWISNFKNGDTTDPKFQQRLIDCFVNAVYLYDDRLVLIYNYKDGTKTITFDEVNEAFGSEGSDLVDLAVPEKKTRFVCVFFLILYIFHLFVSSKS